MKIIIAMLLAVVVSFGVKYRHQLDNFNDISNLYNSIKTEYLLVKEKKEEIEGELAGLKIVNSSLNKKLEKLKKEITRLKSLLRKFP